jgi:2,3-bisphosphoglycerate-dependent phosphoglycerate mutase
MMIPSTIYLVRHAESAVNARQGVPAQYDASGAPLTDRGRQQARELALHFQDLPIAHVYSFNLLRAHQTALILANDRPISISSRLRERDCCNSASQRPETYAAVVARITSILNEIACHHAGENVIVVSHGYVMRVLLVALGFATFEQLPQGAIVNTGYIKFIFNGEQFTIAEMVGVYHY